MLAERAEQLPVAGVDGVDTGRAGAQQHPREASGRGAEVERDPAVDLHRERLERSGELRLASQGLLALRAQRDRGVAADERGRVDRDTAVDEDTAVSDRFGRVDAGMRVGEQVG